jgi:hypothetical protein
VVCESKTAKSAKNAKTGERPLAFIVKKFSVKSEPWNIAAAISALNTPSNSVPINNGAVLLGKSQIPGRATWPVADRFSQSASPTLAV